ncbi:transposase [Streptococcus acidominimus]|uniref:Transposase n=1 Tax=Streptococcus acidominimus TaxID=1326 RepID=A0A380IHJ9_STRAI|nr:transposase [Streptococcus acidominimus]
MGNLQTQALDVTLFQVYYAMAMGIYFAAVVIRTRSLWWAIFIHFIVFHFLYNTCYNKSMAYGIDFRKRVIAYKNSGHSKQETCKVFGISRNTLYLWEKQLETLGTLEISPRKRKPFKIPLDQLEAYVEAHPDAFLREIAEQFNCRPQSVWMALKKIGITLKKDNKLSRTRSRKG